MLEKYINEIEPYVIELFKDDTSGHDISHLKRVMRMALYIQEKEGGDRIVIGIAAFLHDIHRIMTDNSKEYHFFSPKDSIPKVNEILDKTDLTDDVKSKICFAIENHENYNWNGNNVKDINSLILQDADNMDAIGAIGIARAFEGGGHYGVHLYDDSIELENSEDFVEGAKDPSVIHHFYRKLYRLENNMNTTTGKELANERTNYMKNFVKEFINEWNWNS